VVARLCTRQPLSGLAYQLQDPVPHAAAAAAEIAVAAAAAAAAAPPAAVPDVAADEVAAAAMLVAALVVAEASVLPVAACDACQLGCPAHCQLQWGTGYGAAA